MSEWFDWGLSFVALVMAIILHEVAHGYAALTLGDDTAKSQGRLSLNPLVHVDRVGTIILPGIFLLAQAALHTGGGVFFGWAKPVPIAPWRFRDPRRGMMLVALAGPLANFALTFLSLLALNFTPLLAEPGHAYVLSFLGVFIMANVALGTFNLLPIPPLDGGRVMVGLLPERLAMVWARLERVGIVIVLLGVFVLPSLLGHYGIQFNPLWSWLHAIGDPIFRTLAAAAGYPRDLFVILHSFSADGGV